MGSIPRKSLHLPPAARAVTGTPSLAHSRTPSGPAPTLIHLVKVTILLSLQYANQHCLQGVQWCPRKTYVQPNNSRTPEGSCLCKCNEVKDLEMRSSWV